MLQKYNTRERVLYKWNINKSSCIHIILHTCTMRCNVHVIEYKLKYSYLIPRKKCIAKIAKKKKQNKKLLTENSNIYNKI